MDVQKLVGMVQQIEKNMPDHGDIVSKISSHLIRFWTPKMRSDLYAEVNAHRENFSPVVVAVIDDMRAQAMA